jgi:hypothetical protein
MRRLWLTGLISEVHTASRQTYGSRRIHAELTIGMKLQVSERLVAVLMGKAGIRGLPGPAKVKRLHGIATADDLECRAVDMIHGLSGRISAWIGLSSPSNLKRIGGSPRGGQTTAQLTMADARSEAGRWLGTR